MAGGGRQPAEGTAEVGKADMGLGQGGGGCPDLRPDILGSCTVGNVVRVVDMGNDPTNWEGVG